MLSSLSYQHFVKPLWNYHFVVRVREGSQKKFADKKCSGLNYQSYKRSWKKQEMGFNWNSDHVSLRKYTNETQSRQKSSSRKEWKLENAKYKRLRVWVSVWISDVYGGMQSLRGTSGAASDVQKIVVFLVYYVFPVILDSLRERREALTCRQAGFGKYQLCWCVLEQPTEFPVSCLCHSSSLGNLTSLEEEY